VVTRDLLRSLRNDLPMAFTIQQLGGDAPYSKCVEGRLRFVCPHCGELLATVNPRNNLAHCFNCGKNINNIDLLLLAGYDFKGSVALLQKWLFLYKRETSGPPPTAPATRTAPQPNGAQRLVDILRQDLGNDGPAR